MNPVKKPILVVEDDLDLQQILAYNFKNAGFDVVQHTDGLAAWRWLQQNDPALIVLDVLLPGVNGIDLFARLRETERLAATPVVVTTALQEDETKRQGYRLGAAMVFRKPLSPTRLVKHVVAALAGVRHPIDLAALPA